MSGSGMTLRDLSDVKITLPITDETALIFDANTGKFGARVLADSDIPAAIARDAEVTAAISAALGYASYVALLTQTATDDPTIVTLHNGLSAPVLWARSDVGTYTGTLVGAFTENKTACFATGSEGTTLAMAVTLQRTSADVVTLRTYDDAGAAMDAGLSGTAIEIRVYP